MPDQLEQRVISVMAASQHIPADSIAIDKTLEELKIDSLDGINIVFALENEFNINIPDESAQKIRTVRDLVEGVRQLVMAQEPQPSPKATA